MIQFIGLIGRYWRVAAFVLLPLFGFLAGWQFGADRCVAKQLAAERLAFAKYQQDTEKNNAISAELEISLQRINERASNMLAERLAEYEKSDYSSCIIPANGVRLYNAALSSGSHSS